jgi:hypothetical protein
LSLSTVGWRDGGEACGEADAVAVAVAAAGARAGADVTGAPFELTLPLSQPSADDRTNDDTSTVRTGLTSTSRIEDRNAS